MGSAIVIAVVALIALGFFVIAYLGQPVRAVRPIHPLPEALWVVARGTSCSYQSCFPVSQWPQQHGITRLMVIRPNGVSYLTAQVAGGTPVQLLFDWPYQFGRFVLRVYRHEHLAQESLVQPLKIDPTLYPGIFGR